MDASCSAVILSGGLNTRMGGQNKAFLEVGGQPILDRLVGILGELFSEILVVTRQPALYRGRGLTIVTDILQIRSSLTGIHAGLVHCSTSHAFIVGCDTPFLKKALIERLLAELNPQADLIIPAGEGHYQPLCAIYSKRCIGPAEEQLQRGDLKVANLIPKIKVIEVPFASLQAADPELVSFFNVNSPRQLRQTEAMSDKG